MTALHDSHVLPRTRMLRVPGLPNVRDAGGLRGPGTCRVRSRILLRGPAPGPRTAAGLSRLGVRTVVDLRHPNERHGTDFPVDPGVRVLRRPLSADMTGIRGVRRPQPAAYLAHYRLLLPQAAPVAVEIIGLLAGPSAAPVYVCCAFGKDRTGVVCALVLRALRVRLAEVAGDYALTARAYRMYRPEEPLPEWASAYAPGDLAARTATSGHTMRLLLTGIEQDHHDLPSYLEPFGLHRPSWRDAIRRSYRREKG
ncbi:tyrosine-protein phosphatase [Nocardia sp. NPDC088792]|uniref:tyrosine-protein phosphatase n=1 Tax=Nocardia sp. NPDC088792 TaxID=3364332 RepID=UPI00381B4A1B